MNQACQFRDELKTYRTVDLQEEGWVALLKTERKMTNLFKLNALFMLTNLLPFLLLNTILTLVWFLAVALELYCIGVVQKKIRPYLNRRKP